MQVKTFKPKVHRTISVMEYWDNAEALLELSAFFGRDAIGKKHFVHAENGHPDRYSRTIIDPKTGTRTYAFEGDMIVSDAGRVYAMSRYEYKHNFLRDHELCGTPFSPLSQAYARAMENARIQAYAADQRNTSGWQR